jgi:hypothetical protein
VHYEIHKDEAKIQKINRGRGFGITNQGFNIGKIEFV